MIYLFVASLICYLIIQYDINSKSENKKFWYVVVLVLLILIAGFRWRLGSDTPTYLTSFYYETPTLDKFLNDVPLMSPLWELINSIVFTLGGRFFIVQFIQASFVNTLYFLYIHKHSRYIFTCVLFYYVWMYTNQNMEVMKAAMAIVVCLFGNDYIIDGKLRKGFFLYLIGCLFHISSLMMFLNPLLLFLRFKKRAIVFFALVFFLGYIIKTNIGNYFLLFGSEGNIADKVATYANSDEYGVINHNINWFIFNVLPFIIYSFACIYYLRRKKNYCLKFEPFILVGLMYMILMWNVFIFYRYVHFYRIYFILIFVEAIYTIVHRSYLQNKKLFFLKSFVLFFPILIYMSLYNFQRKEMYYPYSSIFERTIDKERERTYSGIGHIALQKAYPIQNEY